MRTVLVVGGGVGGMSCAIALRRLGLAVDLIEIDPGWKIYGAGITITSPTLRAFNRLGILEQVKQQGATWQRGQLYAPDGRLVGTVEWPPFAPGQPSAGGIMRPTLHRILSTVTRESGVSVRLGTTVTDLRQDSQSVHVRFSDGSESDYDLVVGADGIFSKLRERLFPHAPKPEYTGQAVYRIVVERPPGLDGSRFYPRGDALLGCSLVSSTHMYLFVLLNMPGNPWIPVEDQPQHLYESMAGWGDFVPALRERVRESPVRETINYRPLEALILPPPWQQGRVVLIGDAAHATTPHMASGAGMAVEDGLILADEVQGGGSIDEVLQRFVARRFDRCRTVVENSLRLGEMEMRGDSPAAHNQLVKDTIAVLIREP